MNGARARRPTALGSGHTGHLFGNGPPPERLFQRLQRKLSSARCRNAMITGDLFPSARANQRTARLSGGNTYEWSTGETSKLAGIDGHAGHLFGNGHRPSPNGCFSVVAGEIHPQPAAAMLRSQ